MQPFDKQATFIISCGGTGGHLAPGIATAQALTRRNQACVLAISQKKVDQALIATYPQIQFIRMAGGPLSLSNPWRGLKSLFAHSKSTLFALKFIKRHKPCVILGFGGFSMTSFVLAGRLLKQKVVLHEANHQAGKAIRFLARFADKIFLPKKVFLRGIKKDVLQEMGLPLRDEMQQINRQSARQALGLPTEGKLLLIFGGSQGAYILNHWVREHIDFFAKEGIHIVCLTGLSEPPQHLRRYNPEGRPIEIQFIPFSQQMAYLLCAADLAITRSGAGSLAELARMRLPAILVPFPYAADDHQTANALYYENAGAGKMLPQSAIDQLWKTVKELLFNEETLEAMRQAMAHLDQDNAQEALSFELLKLAYSNFGKDVSTAAQKNHTEKTNLCAEK